MWHLKGQVQCFLMQVIINKYFLLNLEKIGTDPSYRFREKRENPINSDTLHFQKIMSLNRRLGYSNNQLNC